MVQIKRLAQSIHSKKDGSLTVIATGFVYGIHLN